MRANHLVMLLAVSLVGFSGCLGFGDDGGGADDDCPADDHAHDNGNATEEHGHDCPAQTDGGTEDPLGNQTDLNGTDVPNELPVASLNMSTDDGAIVNATSFVFVGTNITFSAEGSTDPDGTIDLVGLTVRDSNSTRTAQLFQDGAFAPATFLFEHEGTVNVTLRVLDDRGEATVIETATFVNRVQGGTQNIQLAGGTASGASADDCESPSSTPSNTLTADATSKPFGFQVAAGAQWIEATLTAGSGEIAICSPDGDDLSDAGSDTVMTREDVVDLPPGIDYYVFVLSGSSPNADYTVEIVVHHEPRPAA